MIHFLLSFSTLMDNLHMWGREWLSSKETPTTLRMAFRSSAQSVCQSFTATETLSFPDTLPSGFMWPSTRVICFVLVGINLYIDLLESVEANVLLTNFHFPSENQQSTVFPSLLRVCVCWAVNNRLWYWLLFIQYKAQHIFFPIT